MKILLFIFVTVVATLAAGDLAARFSGAEQFDVRQVRWGMTIDEVKAAEKKAGGTFRRQKGERLVYSITMGGQPATIVYTFRNGGLLLADFNFLQKHDDPNQFLADYDSLKAILAETFGKPMYTGPKWFLTTFKEQPEKWGFAVSAGHVQFDTHWQTDRSSVNLVLEGGDLNVNLRLNMGSLLPEKQPKAEAIKEEQ